MVSRLLYFCILIPLSWLPLPILHFLFKGVYIVIYYIIGYRKKVVYSNLTNSFPDKKKSEIKKIVKTFYKNLASMLAESIKNLSISETELRARMCVENPEIIDELFLKNKSVILMGNHQFNWEFLITGQNLFFKHQAIGIGTPLSNKFLDKKINKRRGRFGMQIVNSSNYKTSLANNTKRPTATLVLGDQSPSSTKNAFWSSFMNQSTAFFFGGEIIANQTDFAVIYCKIIKQCKGKYSVKLIEITQQPLTLTYGKITQSYIKFLENDIIETPSNWLWSHKRWKINEPKNINEIKAEHKNRFEEKFRTKH